MKPILSPAESAALDRETQARGISPAFLMENAGRAVARAAAVAAGGLYGRRAVSVCGKGNNGGDGLVAARYLAQFGMHATAVLLAEPSSLRDPAAENFRRLEGSGVVVRRGPALARELGRADVAVDAIFGTGFRGIPEDEHASAIEALNAASVPVVAVDIPSGVNGETGAVEGDAVWATVTVTFGAAKPGLVLHPGAARAGIVEVAPIGFPADLVRSDLLLVEAPDVAGLLPHRGPDDHKRTSGVVLVIGGSRAMTGAVRLMAASAYRTGAGLVTAAVPRGILPVVQAGIAEATFVPLPETEAGTVAEAALEALTERLGQFDAVAVGPGLTTHPETASFVRSLVRACPVLVVVDADALNAFGGRAGELADRQADAVLTPHAGEFGRLASMTAREVGRDRVGHARKLAGETSAVVILKGSPMLVASPGGEVRVNTTGGPELATAGSGDVLTGMTAAMLGRGLGPADAATVAAYLHGLAGSLAAVELGEGTTAGDVVARIPDAVARVMEMA
ncbi:MAG: NAD(P)H-hydrate dehydratase [Actinomycetota bacterium]|nr:NAD(P)H-hydrate dehydratase [Actinomycetota bacterium]